jgi:hypothetical protein
VSEAHFAEIEKTLLYVSEARERAERAGEKLRRDAAEPHLAEALEEAERDLLAVHRRLMQATYFAVPALSDEQTTLPALPREQLTL